jgi:two-component system phosphate regulon sensor histidine kinase PhoR
MAVPPHRTVAAPFLGLSRRRRAEAPKTETAETPATTPHAAALEALSDPVMLVTGAHPDDLTGRMIVFANAAARELFRLPAEGGRLVSAFRNPEVLEAIDESLFGGVTREAIYEPRGAQERIWRVRTTPLPGSADTTRQALVHFRDETDSRRAERSRVDFLANASHELRTPLASLSGFIETLRGHARDDPEAREQFLRIMTAQAERMSRLIDDLMSLSRIELNEHVPPRSSCDLALAVVDVVDALRPLTAEKTVQLDLVLPERGEATLIGDRHQIVQVVQNFLDNALKYSPAGATVKVEVTHGLKAAEALAASSPAFLGVAGAGRLSLLTPDRAPEETRYAMVRITDAGPGMAREHLPRLAERFYRVEGQKSGEKLGTGLGLAIAKHVVNRHRGGMIVESAPGFGTAFTAYFPAEPNSADAPTAAR